MPYKSPNGLRATIEATEQPNIFFSVECPAYENHLYVILPAIFSDGCLTQVYKITDGSVSMASSFTLQDVKDDDLVDQVSAIQGIWWKPLLRFKQGRPWKFPEKREFFPKMEGSGDNAIAREWLYRYASYLAFEFLDRDSFDKHRWLSQQLANIRPLTVVNPRPKAPSLQQARKAIYSTAVPIDGSPPFTAVAIGQAGYLVTTLEALAHSQSKNHLELKGLSDGCTVVARVCGTIGDTCLVALKAPKPILGLSVAFERASIGGSLMLLGAFEDQPYLADCVFSGEHHSSLRKRSAMILSGSSVDSATGGAIIDANGYLIGIMVAERFTEHEFGGHPIPERTPGVFFGIGVERFAKATGRRVPFKLRTFIALELLGTLLKWMLPAVRIVTVTVVLLTSLAAIGALAWNKGYPIALRLWREGTVAVGQSSPITLCAKSPRTLKARARAKVRTGPSVDAQIIAELQSGDQVESKCVSHTVSNEPWFEIEHEGQVGYVRADVVTILKAD